MLCMEQFVAGVSNRFCARKAVEFFRGSIPKNNVLSELPHDDCVMCLVQKIRLSTQNIFGQSTTGNVVVEFKDSDGLLPITPLQRPPASHHYLRSIRLRMPAL